MHVNEEQGCKVNMGKNWSQVLSFKSPKCTTVQWVVTVCGLYSAAEHAVAATTVVYLLLPLQWSRNSKRLEGPLG